MRENNFLKEISVLIIASLVLGISFMYPSRGIDKFIYVAISIFILTLINLLVKKLVAYKFETSITTKLWSVFRFGFREKMHFKRPVSMIWLPILTSLLFRGNFVWLPITEFDVVANPERVSKRHGLYRYTEVTEWHIAWIAIWGVVSLLISSIIGYILGFEEFAKLGIAYAFFSLIPISSLDGSKIFFGSKTSWLGMIILTTIMFLWSLTII